MKTLIKVTVGSQAHGLATPESDVDVRGVFVQPTKEILSVRGAAKRTSWNEGRVDDTSWEVGHFLHLATRSNPTILEVFLSPVLEEHQVFGPRLRALFPYVWSSRGVRDAFVGYGLNQRKKFLERKDSRPHKYAAAYARVLYNGWELLTSGTFTVRIADTPAGSTIRRFKDGEYSSPGEVIDWCEDMIAKLDRAYEANSRYETNLDVIDRFLLDVRKAAWDGLPD